MAVTIFEATFGEDVIAANEFPNDGNDGCGVINTDVLRIAEVFDLTDATPASGDAITAGATISKVELIMTTDSSGTGQGSETWDIRRYGALGNDPQADNAATAFGRCTGGQLYATTTLYRTNSTTHTVDLGADGVTDAQSRFDASGTVWAIAIKQQNETTGRTAWASFNEYTAATAANRPRLQVTWTAAAAAVVRDPIYLGFTPGPR